MQGAERKKKLTAISQTVLEHIKSKSKSMPHALENSSSNMHDKWVEITLDFFPLPRTSSKSVKIEKGATACLVFSGVL